MRKNKKIIIGCLLFLELISVFLTFKSFNNRPINNIKEEASKVDKKLFAMFINDGNDNYSEYSGNKFPEGYVINTTKSACVDGNGNKVDNTLSFNNGKVTVVSGKTLYCYLYFDEQVDIKVNVIGNTYTNGVPSKVGNATLSCDSATGTYNNKYNRIEISALNNGSTKCDLTYSSPSSKTYLNTHIKDTLTGTTQGTGQVVHETIVEDNSYYEFGTDRILGVSNDTTYPFTYDSDSNQWTSSNKGVNNSTGTITFTVITSGTYSVSYMVSSESNYDKGYIYLDETTKGTYSGTSNTTFTELSLGSLTAGQVIKVSYSKDSSSASGNDNFIFSISKDGATLTSTDYDSGTYIEDKETVLAGYRYEGKNPNNYVWFNNELWRIIGVFDENSHGQSGEYLTKIIRADSIGGLAWHKSNTNAWVDASLNKLLNGAYLNKEDGTDSGYCYGYSTTVQANCDYREIGIDNTYRGMIKNVTWYLGGYSSTSATTDAFYGYERGSTVYSGRATSTTGYIGLMYPSDYGYSVLASSCARTTNIGSYNTAACAGQSWLYGQGYEWTITQNSSYSYDVFHVYISGSLYSNYAYTGYSVRPTLYLDASVYTINSSDSNVGTIENPYIIGMD